jgi:translation initiation factor IF-2
MNELLETILLVAEMEELKTDISVPAQGIVVESFLDSQKGPIATLILDQGILEEGDVLGTSTALGKIKCLFDFQGKRIGRAMPSQPVSVLGFEKPPKVGDCFKVYPGLEQAQAGLGKEELDFCRTVMPALQDGQKALNIIVKADVLGSLEALVGVLKNLPQEKVVLRILSGEVGDINVSDIKLAEGGKARIFGFRVKTEEAAKNFAEQRKVRIKTFDIIYDLVQEVRAAMTGALEPETKRVDLGKLKVTVLFKQGKEEQIVGGKVLEGEISGESRAAIFRQEEKIGEGKVRTVQQEKKNVSKVPKGQECAMLIKTGTKIAEDDLLTIFKEERQKGTL